MGFTGDEAPIQGDVILDKYIVVLKPLLTAGEAEAHCSQIKSLYNQQTSVSPTGGTFNKFSIGPINDAHAMRATSVDTSHETMRGYTGIFLPETLQTIKSSNDVAYVEPDRYVSLQEVVRQPNPPSWGLSRVSHRGIWNATNNEYVYDSEESGDNVTAYVIDTGIKTDHQDFGTRARIGVNLISNSQNTDTDGHGTHVAGTIGGTLYGVAKNISIIGVKVYPDGPNPTTPMSKFIEALEWVVRDATLNGNITKSVVNISSGGPLSTAMNQAIASASRLGLIVVVAAGNSGIDAINTSPASAPHAITVSAINRSDKMPSWSNWGRIIDVSAPGVDITSCGISSPTASAVMSGTSMASPHVAGLICCLREKPGYSSLATAAYELRERAEGQPIVATGQERGTPNLVATNLPVNLPSV